MIFRAGKSKTAPAGAACLLPFNAGRQMIMPAIPQGRVLVICIAFECSTSILKNRCCLHAVQVVSFAGIVSILHMSLMSIPAGLAGREQAFTQGGEGQVKIGEGDMLGRQTENVGDQPWLLACSIPAIPVDLGREETTGC